MLKLRVRNFQSITDAKIEVEGLTVITGKSNQGKSSLIRAVAAMLFGLPGEHFVKRGQDFTGGAILIEDPTKPLKIVWRKVSATKRKPSLQPLLEINGQMHTKLGRDHKNLTAPHGITEIETAATRLRPQVAMQHDPIFLIGENETTVAEVFKQLGRVDVITEAQRKARADLKATETKRGIRTEDQSKAGASLQELDYIPALRIELEKTKTRHASHEEKIERLRQLIEKLRQQVQLEPNPVPVYPAKPKEPPAHRALVLLEELTKLKPRDVPEKRLSPMLVDRTSELLIMNQLKSLELSLRVCEKQEAEFQLEREDLERKKEEMELELQVCPTCGKEFNDHKDHTQDERPKKVQSNSNKRRPLRGKLAAGVQGGLPAVAGKQRKAGAGKGEPVEGGRGDLVRGHISPEGSQEQPALVDSQSDRTDD